MRISLFFLLLPFLLLSCKPNREKKIEKKWIAVGLISPQLDESIAQQKMFIDTVGKTTSPEENEKLYGVRNIDSMRQFMRIQLDSFIAMQKNMISNTWLDFRKDHTVITDFGNGVDTVKWYFDDDGNLMLDEMEQKGSGSKIKMTVTRLEDTVLHLQFNENNFSSTAVFRPESQ